MKHYHTYVLSNFYFNQDLFIYFPTELIIMMKVLFNYILKKLKLFYDDLKTNNHQFITYYNDFIKRLIRSVSTYGHSLFYRYQLFGIVDLQTNNILIIANNSFVDIKKQVIKTAKFMTRKQTYLSLKTYNKFNSTWICWNKSKKLLKSCKTNKKFVGICEKSKKSHGSLQKIIKDHEILQNIWFL